ncbi:hypothetical protein [Halodesulfovibrio aestuarii]|uniref:Uncharacterized protein n=1 Tax=Halodesulfovibrio aestuarii TaxID=126333 RepID=A0ABV4JNF0_9BACT
MSKLTKQQRIATAKKNCRITVAVACLYEAVERLWQAQGVLTRKEKLQAEKVMNWTQKVIAQIGIDTKKSHGIKKEFNRIANTVLAKRQQYISAGDINPIQGCMDIFAMAQLVTDLQIADGFKSREWTYLVKTTNTLTSMLYIDLQDTDADEIGCNCALDLFDTLYPEYESKLTTPKVALCAA